jgi:hypothetical protein
LKKRPRTPTGGTLFPLRLGRDQARDSTGNQRVTIRIDAKGYPVFKSGFYRDVRVHRMVAGAMQGRPPTKDEDVHHHDGNKLNFDPSNLEIVGKAQHGWYSAIQHYWVPRMIATQEKREWEDWMGEALG